MENPKITQEEITLINEAKSGNMRAFNKLYYRYKNMVDAILNQYIDDEDESKDLANIVFLKVYNKLSSFESYESFGGWIRVIASRTALDYLRQSYNKLTVVDEENIRLMSETSTSDADLVNQMSYEQILKEVDNLPNTARKVFKLFYLRNLTMEQISKRMRLPLGTVKSHLSRSRRRIKNKIIKH
jgi:RNA polymerase sigma-70 factor (ECF subfamily)